MRKILKYTKVVISTLLVFLLSGCVKLNVDLQVSPNDMVSGNAILALSDALAGLADSESEVFGEEVFSEGDGVRQVPYSEGGFTGTQIFFESVPIEIFSQDSAEDDFIRIVRDGDNLITSGNFSSEEELGQDESNVLGEDFLEEILSSSDVSVSITYPGKILETNGTVNGNTITWKPTLGAENEISAIVYAPKGLSGWIWWVLASLGAAALIGLISFLIIRSRKISTSAKFTEKEFDSVDAISGDTPRPIFSYQILHRFYQREYFDLKLTNDTITYTFLRSNGTPTTSAVHVPISEITDAAVLEKQRGLGIRIIHQGGVELLPAKGFQAKTLVGTLKSLIKGSQLEQNPEDSQEKSKSGGSASVSVSLEEDLRSLKRLLEEQIISEDEFVELKRKRISRA
jgi:hypothetical protein